MPHAEGFTDPDTTGRDGRTEFPPQSGGASCGAPRPARDGALAPAGDDVAPDDAGSRTRLAHAPRVR